MYRKLMVAGALGWLLSWAGGSHAQEPRRENQKPSTDKKSPAPSSDGNALASDPQAAAAAAAALLEGAYEGQRPPEAVRMLATVLRGSSMGPGDGWFGPAESRYSWKWLAERCGVDPDQGAIPRSAFRGPEALFPQLDRDKDGIISPDDLDWSDRNPYLQASAVANRLFRKLNAGSNGRLTKDELMRFFEQAAQGKDHLSADDFRDALLSGLSGRARPSDAPSPAVLIRGLFAGELGSMNEGPKLNEPAPDFSLKSVDGKEVVELAKLTGPGAKASKPVVLVFGSFT
jgi:hypothetical protein